MGAVQQYVHEALQAFDRIRRDEEEARQIQAEREEAGRRRMEEEPEAERKGKELLNALSVEERQALYEEVKNDLLMKFPQVSGWKPEAIEPAIEARMVSRLFQKSQTEGCVCG